MVFEPDSCLECIDRNCFGLCGIMEIVIPRSVRSIEDYAFDGCLWLSSLRFEEGSQLGSVGKGAFRGTCLNSLNVQYPDTFGSDGREYAL